MAHAWLLGCTRIAGRATDGGITEPREPVKGVGFLAALRILSKQNQRKMFSSRP